MQIPDVSTRALRGAKGELYRQVGASQVLGDRQNEIFDDPATPVGGNPHGDVTIVEFFDYRCPYCKQVEPALQALLDQDHKLRFIYKEMPVLGPTSVLAARDGVLAYFGCPQAHEHDAEHAVQAGLALVEAAPKLTTAAGVPLQVRVGIATGLVVVGDLIGAGSAQEQAVVGETPNLAARLQALAEPGAVVIADSTRRLLRNLFELTDLGARDLKGIAGPARAWAALRARSVGSRFDALHTTGLTELVGREEESELLLRRWSRAKTGEGQVVLLSGEAGIGKSRLTAALLERLAPARAVPPGLITGERPLEGYATCGKSAPRRRQKRPRAAETLGSFKSRYEIL